MNYDLKLPHIQAMSRNSVIQITIKKQFLTICHQLKI